LIIECPHCESKVNGEVKGEVPINDDEYPFPVKVVLVSCPVCQNPLLGMTELIQVGEDKFEWDNLHRQWPAQEGQIDRTIPDIARLSLIEAKVCFKAKAYSACAVMCGRTIEGVCVHHDAKIKTLANGLKALKETGVIDTRLYNWGDALRTHRNLGAHATTEKVSKEDARDLLDFSIAICEYVFILNEKFKRFQARQTKA
jgi:Domain of unknown function (DUF4145)